jgi:transcriptional regulator with XRE-family HTH domain
MRLTSITPLTSGLVEVHTYDNHDQAAASLDMKSSAVTDPPVASRIASRWARRGIRPATYRDTAGCVTPIFSAKSACDSLLRARNRASVMSARYQTGMETQAPYTRLGLDDDFGVKYRNGMNPLRTFREKAGLSQQQLADKAGTPQPQIVRLEKEPDEDDYREMTVSWALRLAPPLGITPIELFPQLLETLRSDSIDALLVGTAPEVREAAYRSVVETLTKALAKVG